MRFLAAFFVSTLLPNLATAESYSGNSFYETCLGTPSSHLLCVGYLKGVIDGVRGYLIYKDLPYNSKQELESALVQVEKGYPFCTPKSGTINQYVEIVVTRLERIPEERHLPASFLIIETLSEAFPCK